MRVTFVTMGWENPSVEYISACLKAEGHHVSLAYEQSLFDDKNYLCIPFLARLFDQGSNLLHQIVASRPDVVAFSVMAINYQWGIRRAAQVKELLDVPIVFGGYHAITCPDVIIARPPVDAVCLNEGELAMADLLGRLQEGTWDTTIPGLWFKDKAGQIIKNPRRPLIADLDAMPLPDKDLYAPVVPIRNYYLAVTNRGCPYNCTYCSVSTVSDLERDVPGFKKVRERSVDSVLHELRVNKEKYDFKWVDFRNAVFSYTPSWVLEFCARYPQEIGLPFRIFSHPLLIREDLCIALRDAGCFGVQMGLESYDPTVRNEILNRHETNAQIDRAIQIMEKVGINYSLDYILGLPGQSEEELQRAAALFANLRHLYRISPFMLSYLPRTRIIDQAVAAGILGEEENRNIDEGLHGNYMDEGSPMERKRRRMFQTYKLLFRSMSFMPIWLRRLFYHSRAYVIFYVIPFDFILRLFDLSMVFRDRDARAYALNYWWWFRKRFDPASPNHWRKKLEPGTAQADALLRQITGKR
ncbi:MAG: radical SAM protein [Magnetococcales bacterium]|nr:radical SAM protein [Magnetococcales bacterium]